MHFLQSIKYFKKKIKSVGFRVSGKPSSSKQFLTNFAQIFAKINEENSFGIVPVENSSEGSVNQTLDCLQSQNLIICGELELSIKHALLSKSDNLKNISTIYGHEQALSQCKLWLSKNLPNVKLPGVVQKVMLNGTSIRAFRKINI